MPAEKRNQFLDAEESDEDVGGYDSEEELHKGGRSAKRRRVEAAGVSDDEDDVASIDDVSDVDAEREDSRPKEGEHHDQENAENKKTEQDAPKTQIELPGVSKPLTKKNLVATEAAIKKSGVVYLSRIPPFMKPQKLRSLLEPYGKLNRIFLTPEDPQEHSRRVRNGGNKKRMYTDGWVEFINKKDAKKAVDLLNARTIGGKKGSYYRDDIWNLLYLKGFKWHNLTEQIAAEAAEKASRMRAEISRTTRENKEFVRNVEKAKMLNGMQAKAAAKGKRKAREGSAEEMEKLRTFEQAHVAKRNEDVGKLPEDAQRVSKLLFG